MIRFPLALRRTDGPVHEPRAWLIPGDDPARWLEEMRAWGVPLDALRLHVLPRAAGDRGPHGVLVTATEDVVPRTTPRALPYGLAGGRVYLPVDTRLAPAPTDEELARAPGPPVLVLHPAVGLVGFGARDVRRVADLVRTAEPRAIRYAPAPRVAPLATRLLAVEPAGASTLDELFAAERELIGSRRPALPPEHPDVQEAREATGAACELVLTALQWLAQWRPGWFGSAPWLRQLDVWVRAVHAAEDPVLRSPRELELERLAKLLETDPDEGLKQAIPLADLASRGLGDPAAELATATPDFDASRLAGGRASDPWVVPRALITRLKALYLKAAARARSAGRHRAAAYIHAALLGDRSAAARALREGSHFAEAAALYRDHLSKPVEAARCLELAGQRGEALALFTDHEQWLDAARVARALDRADDARTALHRAVGAFTSAGRPLDAARVLEQDLANVDEALRLLDTSAGSHGPSSLTCAFAALDLLGRQGRHDEARRRVRDLTAASARDAAAGLVERLAERAARYPDTAVRALCADRARVLAGRALPGADAASTAALTRALVALDAEDPLLARDAARWRLRAGPAQLAPAHRRVPAADVLDPRDLRELPSPDPHAAWHAFAHVADAFVLIGRDVEGRILAARVTEAGAVQVVRAPLAPESRPLFAAGDMRAVAVDTPSLLLPRDDHFDAPLDLTVPPGLPSPLHALAFDEHDILWAVHRAHDGALHLAAHARGGSLLAQHPVEDAPHSDVSLPLALAVRHGHAVLACGTRLWHLAHRSRIRWIDLSAPIHHLAVPPAHQPFRIAAATRTGVALLTPGSAPLALADDDAVSTRISFTSRGDVALLSRTRLTVHTVRAGTAFPTLRVQLDHAHPVAIAPTPHAVAILSRDGRIFVA